MKILLKHLGIPLEGLDPEPTAMDLKENATIRDMMDELMKQHPQLTLEHFRTTSFLIQGKKADETSILSEGDKVLLLRMLGGG